MADYTALALVNDPDALLEIGVNYMEDSIPGFIARPGNVETVLLEAQSQIGAEVVQQAEIAPPIAFAWAGEALFGIPPHSAVPATSTATVTFATDTPATMIAAQTMLSVPHPSGTSVIFTTDTDVNAPEGGGDVLVGVTALEAGADANGAFGVSQFIDDVQGVQALNVQTASGGVDAETDADYLDRVADALTLLAPRPILPNDFAVYARQTAGVGRTTAIDLYQPGTDDNVAAGQPGGPLTVEGSPVNSGPGLTNVERCVTTVITGLEGQPPTQTLMHTVWQSLQAAREVNFLAYVIAPHYTQVDVKATVRAFPGYLAEDVIAACEVTLGQWLDPGRSGSSSIETGDTWTLDSYARIYEAVDYLNRADGVFFVVSVQLRRHGDATWSDADIPLTGIAPLPLAGDFEITVETT